MEAHFSCLGCKGSRLFLQSKRNNCTKCSEWVGRGWGRNDRKFGNSRPNIRRVDDEWNEVLPIMRKCKNNNLLIWIYFSAYCGSLWLAALSCISCMAEELGKEESLRFFEDVLMRAKEAFVKKLWNGRWVIWYWKLCHFNTKNNNYLERC